ncbi:MAG: hypothetical protein ACTSRZ_00365 [Promethearchaeota archaeon]
MKIKIKLFFIIGILFLSHIYWDKVGHSLIENRDNFNNLANRLRGAIYFDANITTNKNNYTMLENIEANFKFSSFETDKDYFTFGLSTSSNLSDFSSIIFQSEHIEGGFGVDRNYTFILKEIDFNPPENGTLLYICLIYWGFYYGAPNIICTNKEVFVTKVGLNYSIINDNFPIEYTDQLEIKGKIFIEKNISNSYIGLLNYSIFYNGSAIKYNFTTTDVYGNFSILINSSNYLLGNFSIYLSIKSNIYKYFNICISFEITTKKLNLVVNNLTTKINYLQYKSNYILSPVYIDVFKFNQIFISKELNLYIEYNSTIFEMINLNNGSYYYNLKLPNQIGNYSITVFEKSTFFEIEPLHFNFTINKRNLKFELISKSCLSTNITIAFRLVDSFTNNISIVNLEDIYIEIIKENKSLYIPNIFRLIDDIYYLIISIDDLNLTNNEEYILIKIGFNGDNYYKEFSAEVNLDIKNNQFAEENNLYKLIIIFGFLGCSLISTIIFIKNRKNKIFTMEDIIIEQGI